MSLALAACAAPSTEYPSLAIRDAERLVDAPAESTTPAPPAAIPASVLAQADSYLDRAFAADQKFRDASPRVSRIVNAARGAAVASDRWSDAQVAMTDLDAQRVVTATALADLDALYAGLAIELQRRDQIDAMRQAVAGMLAEQDATIARLTSQLRQ